jgi:signal transduction histidine kinase
VSRAASAFLRYGISVAAFSLVVGASSAIRRVWGVSVDTTAFIIMVMIAASWYGGRGPGLVVALLFEGILDYYAGWSKDPLRYAVLAFNRLLLFTSVVLFASARRTAEDRLNRQRGELRATIERERAARAEAEKASRLKDEFLATVSHELRTPLNGILGWVAILNRHDVDAATKDQAMRTIERNALLQARIVEDILDFSGMARGQMRIDPRPVAFAPLIQDAIDTIAASARLKQIAIDTIVDEDQVIAGDSDRVRQIVWNLLSNAVKFTPEGGRITVRLRRADNRAELKVEDNGIGIDGAFLPHAFEAFRQADSTFTREHGGLGLGLAIVRHLVDLHGGTITAQSGEKGGAVFTLRLPLAASDKSADPVTKLPAGDPGIKHSA